MDNHLFLSDVKTRHDKMVRLVETMVTSDGFQLTAYGMKRGRSQGSSEPLAVSRRPTAHPDALVYELYGLTEDEANGVEGVDGRLAEYGVTLTQNERRARSTRSFVSRVASQ